MSTIAVNYEFKASVSETLDAADAPGAATSVVKQAKFNVAGKLDGSSTPAASLASEFTLTGASGTIDLTALATLLGTKSASGKKLRLLRINNRAAATQLNLQVGSSNGYAIGGAAIKVEAGGCAQHYFNDSLAAVDGTHKTLDWTLTGGQSADVTLIFG